MAGLGVAKSHNGPVFFGDDTVTVKSNQLILPAHAPLTDIRQFLGFSILLPHSSAPRIILVPKGVDISGEDVNLELESCSKIGYRCLVKVGLLTLHKKLLEAASGVINSSGKTTICGGGRHLAVWNSDDWKSHCQIFFEQQQQKKKAS
jgi:hypothetical protein